MTQKEMYERYVKEQCKNCANRDKCLGEIRIVQNLDGIIITKCDDYSRDQEKVKKKERLLNRTAIQLKPLMKLNI